MFFVRRVILEESDIGGFIMSKEYNVRDENT
jgi:hypothetical protein